VCRRSFLTDDCAWLHVLISWFFPPRWLVSTGSRCSLLKASRPELLPGRVQVRHSKVVFVLFFSLSIDPSIHTFTYHKLLTQELCWSKADEGGVLTVVKRMFWNRFHAVKTNIQEEYILWDVGTGSAGRQRPKLPMNACDTPAASGWHVGLPYDGSRATARMLFFFESAAGRQRAGRSSLCRLTVLLLGDWPLLSALMISI
jgi:hypothetical protein